MNTTLSNQSEKIKEFAALVQHGYDAWVRAGAILVELVTEDPKIYDKIIEKNPHLSIDILGRFEAMGRNQLHPLLLTSEAPGVKRLRKMPYSIQERYLDDPMELLILTDAGTDTIMVKAREMNGEQVKQAFTVDRLRTLGEQKVWLLAKRAENAVRVGGNVTPTPESAAFSIKGGRVVFRSDVSWSPGELAGIISQMSK